MHADSNGQPSPVQARQRWMAILARADREELEQAWMALAVPPQYVALRPPESGLAQVRGRAGGTGQQFNLGEVTITRCTVQLASGEVGVGYVTGRDGRRAELAALFDALLQTAAIGKRLHEEVVAVLAAAQEDRKRREATAVAATKVDFFTLVRGE